MKASELRLKTVQELLKLEQDLHRESFNLHMQKATGQLNNKDQIKKRMRSRAHPLFYISSSLSSFLHIPSGRSLLWRTALL